MHMKVTKEQFVLEGDKLTHAPTGATLWIGEKDVVCCEQGRLGLETGDDCAHSHSDCVCARPFRN